MEEFMIIIQLIDAGDFIENKGTKEEINEWRRVVRKANDFLKKSEIDADVLRSVMNEVKSTSLPVKEEIKKPKKGSLEQFGL